MDTHKGNISKVPQKLKKIRGENPKDPIEFIETLMGKFSGQNVSEGFRANAEVLCSARTDTTPVSYTHLTLPTKA